MHIDNIFTPEIAKEYDLIISSYYNHENVAIELSRVLYGRKHILEIGIGTGLIAEKMIEKGYVFRYKS